jgi:SAM-dependent methyltransferase
MNKYNQVMYGTPNPRYDEKLVNHIVCQYFDYGGNLLDVGCGNGKHMKIFESYDITTKGLDAREQDDSKISICNIEKDPFPFKNDTFDYVYSKSLFEHILRADNCIKECYRVLKPGGKIVIMVPEWKSQMNHYWDDYSHLHAWTRKSLKDMLEIYGFKEICCKQFYQLPFIWNYPILEFIPKVISVLPESLKWKTKDMRNGEDRKLIRFSKERMLLGYGVK